jgi:hypothetical protein
MDTALPGLADDGHADLVRDTLVTLLTVMRPDWGSRQAVAGRVRHAEQRMKLTLPQVCLRAVTAAVTPNSLPDAFLDATPADALRHLADPEHTSATIAQLRSRLQETSPAPAPAPAAGEPVQRDDPEQVAADRAMLAQAMAVAHRRQGRQEWTRRQRAGEHAADVSHALDGFAIGDPVGQEWDDSATPDDEW